MMFGIRMSVISIINKSNTILFVLSVKVIRYVLSGKVINLGKRSVERIIENCSRRHIDSVNWSTDSKHVKIFKVPFKRICQPGFYAKSGSEFRQFSSKFILHQLRWTWDPRRSYYYTPMGEYWNPHR